MRKNFGEFGNTEVYRDTMRMNRKLHEEELTLQEKIEKICNDKELFKKNFWNLRFLKCILNVVRI